MNTGAFADWEIAFFFGLPFGIAGTMPRPLLNTPSTNGIFSMANEEEQVDKGHLGGRWQRTEELWWSKNWGLDSLWACGLASYIG